MKPFLCFRVRSAVLATRLATLVVVVAAAQGAMPLAAAPVRLGPGPHLFIDDYLIEESEGLKRTTHQPEKLPASVLKKGEPRHQKPLFFMTVEFDAKAGTFQAWYNVLNHGLPPELVRSYAYAESKDGINWSRPELGLVSVNCSTRNNLIATPPSNFGLFLVDDGPGGADPARRFKMAFFRGGLAVAFSPDGRRFTAHPGNPVIRQNASNIKPYAPGYENAISDIIDGCWDPLKKEYLLGCKIERGGYPRKPHYHAEGWRRCVAMSTSKDIIKWEQPRLIVTPDPNNGIEEFYGFKPTLRGDLYLGFLRVLRDDLPADEDGPVNGIGWTELLTSRDGRSWTRHPAKFLDRNRSAGSWDHAMAWLADCVTVGDKDYIYYGGYSAGHKVGDRQIGLALLRKNGFVSRDAGNEKGTLRTPAVLLMGKALTVNARVKGMLRVRLTGHDGAALPGFDWVEISRASGDSVAHTIAWTGDLASLCEKPVRIEFELKQAELCGFDVVGPDAKASGGPRRRRASPRLLHPAKRRVGVVASPASRRGLWHCGNRQTSLARRRKGVTGNGATVSASPCKLAQ